MYVPRNPKLDRLLRAMPDGLSSRADHARLLLHFISVKRWLGDLDRGYARLHSAILRRYVPSRVLRPLKAFLIDHGVIETVGHSAGIRSTGYRITPAFDGPPMCVDIDSRALARKLAAWRASYAGGETDEVHHAVIEDRRPVLDTMRSTLDRLRLAQPAEQLSHLLHGQGEDFDHVLYVCSLIERGHHSDIVVDAFGYRVHTIVTHAAAAIRPHLRIGDEPLVELDITNAQPLILAALLRRPQRCTTYIATARHSGSPVGWDSGFLGLAERIPQGEVDDFVLTCEDGCLYERLMLAGSLGDRDRAKVLLYRDVLFGRPHIRGAMTETFGSLWPSILNMLQELKRRSDHKVVSKLLQRGESEIMIDGVCQRITREMPDAPYLTIHDSILTTPSSAEQVEAIIIDEFQQHGVCATVRRKDLVRGRKNPILYT